jgi:hypothetical protein
MGLAAGPQGFKPEVFFVASTMGASLYDADLWVELFDEIQKCFPSIPQ